MRHQYITVIIGVVFLSLLCTKSSYANRPLELCVRWPLDYDDMDQGEDFLTTPTGHSGTVYVQVPHVLFTLSKNGKTIAKDRLDGNGCVQLDLIPENEFDQKYYLRIWFDVKDNGGRAFNILGPESTEWHNKPEVYEQIILVVHSSTPDNQTWNLDISSTEWSRPVPVASQMMERSSEVGWPADSRIMIASANQNLCGTSGSFAMTSPGKNKQKVCFQSFDNGVLNRAKTANTKTIIAHELGHALAGISEGPMDGDYLGDKPEGAKYNSDYYGQGDHCSRGGTNNHTYSTREWIGDAQREGYAHFMAVATFNERSATDTWFAYYGSQRFDINDNKLAAHTGGELLVNTTGGSGFDGYTDKFCRPPSKFKHLGSEGDWLNFFLALWTLGGDHKFEVSEINQVWRETPGDENLTDVYCVPRTTLASVHGPDPKNGYERSWTCEDRFFIYHPITTPTFTWQGQTVYLDFTGAVAAKKMERGKDYDSLYKTTIESFGILKSRHFYQMALDTKVIY
ncbi:MAG: hypothetical protein JXX14_06995 [Deltaproteobacteria bacterium]|nr:hypothetical protein [Deltaproteobacteria bacterium]